MNKQGQSIIEYALIVILIALGVIFMGPYVLRSIEAHFKLWDESTQDSITENISQAPSNDVPPINPNCTCSDQEGSCGSDGCAANVHGYTHTCSPLLCDNTNITTYCGKTPDPACCTTYTRSACGSTAIPAGDTDANDDANNVPAWPNCQPCANGQIDSSGKCPAGQCSSYPANDCYLGQAIWTTGCSNTAMKCVNDTTCDPQCQGINSPGVIACPNTTTYLSQSNGLTYVANSSLCNPSTKCEVYCDASQSYVFNPNTNSCTNNFFVAPDSSLNNGPQSKTTCTPPDQNGQCCTNWYMNPIGDGSWITVNNCSFNECVSPINKTTTVITGVTFQDASINKTYPYCGTNNNAVPPGAHGNPKEECQVIFSYQ